MSKIPGAGQPLFGGVANVEMQGSEFDLGYGVFIRPTYAHLFAPFTMAFKPPGKYGFHEGPWKTTKGGYHFDIRAEIEMPVIAGLSADFEQQELIWLIACLLRLSEFPFMMVPAISNISFKKVLETEKDPSIYPFETQYRIFGPGTDIQPALNSDNLSWIKDSWYPATMLLKSSPKFYGALKAFDAATVNQRTSLSLLSIWGAIEQLFSPNTGELKYRVSANLAAYLEPYGEERWKLFKELSKLYNDRSTAAHTAKELDQSSLISSYVYLRNALVKMIEMGKVPTQDDLERLQFIVTN